jgi:RNA polymerase-interacting CarD/CdnL/TRCF family regulator
VNRTWVDGVRALWRPFVEHRLKSQARKIFEEVRQRLERGIAAADPVRE